MSHTVICWLYPHRDHERAHEHGPGEDHGHSHGLVDRSIVRSHEGVKAVSISLAVLGLAAGRSWPCSCCRARWRCSPT